MADELPPGEVHCASKRYRRETNYFLHGQHLQVTDSAKYLGVTISDDLQWEKHTQATVAMASRTLGFLSRNFRDCSKQVRDTTYKSMLPYPGTHIRYMLIVLTRSNVALHVMLAAITQRVQPQDASQQWLAH